MGRTMGLKPTTFCLEGKHSIIELRPLSSYKCIYTSFILLSNKNYEYFNLSLYKSVFESYERIKGS